MVIFKNPNNPQQPQKGVYSWYAIKGDKKITIYIGQAGKKSTSLPKGTLFRGVSELQRCTFTSNQKKDNYSTIDTDFIVGTAIMFFKDHGYECVWEHIGNNPVEERICIISEQPILQNEDNTNIKEEFKLRKQSAGYWRLNKQLISEAEEGIFTELLKYIS